MEPDVAQRRRPLLRGALSFGLILTACALAADDHRDPLTHQQASMASAFHLLAIVLFMGIQFSSMALFERVIWGVVLVVMVFAVPLHLAGSLPAFRTLTLVVLPAVLLAARLAIALWMVFPRAEEPPPPRQADSRRNWWHASAEDHARAYRAQQRADRDGAGPESAEAPGAEETRQAGNDQHRSRQGTGRDRERQTESGGSSGPGGRPRSGTRMSRREAAETLGVAEDASAGVLRAAYRRLAMELHPDRHRDPRVKQAMQRRFQRIAAAYEALRQAAG